MTWQEIYNKYKDSELMKEFKEYFIDNRRSKRIFAYLNIKDIWGYFETWIKSRSEEEMTEAVNAYFSKKM